MVIPKLPDIPPRPYSRPPTANAELWRILREAEASARLLRMDGVERWTFLHELVKRAAALRDAAWVETGKGR